VKLTDAKLRVLALMRNLYPGTRLSDLAAWIDRSQTEVSYVLNGKRFTQGVQEDVAQALGVTVGDLFGDWAWFRVAARKLRESERIAG